MHTTKIREADILAYMRQCSTPETLIAVLNAYTARMSISDPACIAIDKCVEQLEGISTVQAESELWEQDDRACKRGNAAGSIPAFLIREAA